PQPQGPGQLRERFLPHLPLHGAALGEERSQGPAQLLVLAEGSSQLAGLDAHLRGGCGQVQGGLVAEVTVETGSGSPGVRPSLPSAARKRRLSWASRARVRAGGAYRASTASRCSL